MAVPYVSSSNFRRIDQKHARMQGTKYGTSRRGRWGRGKFAKRVRKIIQNTKDRKWSELALAASNASTAAVTTSIFTPAQGDQFNQREGDRCQILGFHGKVVVTFADPTNIVRVMFIQWLADDTATIDPPQPNVMTSFVLNTNVTLAPISQFLRNKNDRKKFRVLYDGHFSVSSGGPGIIQRKIRWKKCLPTDFVANATTGRGSVYLVYVSDSTIATHPTVSIHGVLEWCDI